MLKRFFALQGIHQFVHNVKTLITTTEMDNHKKHNIVNQINQTMNSIDETLQSFNFNQTCKYWENGNCEYGDNCMYLHSKKQGSNQSSHTSKVPCRNGNDCYYYKKGICRYQHNDNIQSNESQSSSQSTEPTEQTQSTQPPQPSTPSAKSKKKRYWRKAVTPTPRTKPLPTITTAITTTIKTDGYDSDSSYGPGYWDKKDMHKYQQKHAKKAHSAQPTLQPPKKLRPQTTPTATEQSQKRLQGNTASQQQQSRDQGYVSNDETKEMELQTDSGQETHIHSATTAVPATTKNSDNDDSDQFDNYNNENDQTASATSTLQPPNASQQSITPIPMSENEKRNNIKKLKNKFNLPENDDDYDFNVEYCDIERKNGKPYLSKKQKRNQSKNKNKKKDTNKKKKKKTNKKKKIQSLNQNQNGKNGKHSKISENEKTPSKQDNPKTNTDGTITYAVNRLTRQWSTYILLDNLIKVYLDHAGVNNEYIDKYVYEVFDVYKDWEVNNCPNIEFYELHSVLQNENFNEYNNQYIMNTIEDALSQLRTNYDNNSKHVGLTSEFNTKLWTYSLNIYISECLRVQLQLGLKRLIAIMGEEYGRNELNNLQRSVNKRCDDKIRSWKIVQILKGELRQRY